MAMDAELQRLIDDNAIRRLTAFYSDAVTHLDAARAASIYADDGCISIGGAEVVGRQAIEEGMRQTFSAFGLLQLIEHAGLIEVDGDIAHARWSTIELTIKHGSPDLNVVFGRYEDTLARFTSGWLFKQRRFTQAGRTLIETAKLRMEPAFYGDLLARQLNTI